MGEWPERPLGELASVLRRGTAPVYVEASTVRAIGQRCVRNEGFDARAARPHDARVAAIVSPQPGDVLVNSTGTGTIGRSCVFRDERGDFMVDGHVTLVRPADSEADGRFLNELVQSLEGQRFLESRCFTGSTNQVELSRTQLSQMPVSVPPLEEQRRIADILDTFDEAIRATERLIAKLRSCHRGLAEELTTGSPRSDQWKPEVVTDIVEASRPVTYGIVQPGARQPEGEGVAMIRGQDYDNGMVRTDGLFWVHPDIAKPYRRSSLQPGDLLLTIVGVSVGTVGQVPASLDGANLTQTTARLSIAPSLDRRYFFHSFQTSQFQREVERHTLWSTRPRLNIEAFARMRVVVPPLAEQRRVAGVLDASLRRIEAESTSLSKLRLVRKGLATDLLSGRVRTVTA